MAAVDYLLEIQDIKGESQDHKHKETIEISSFSWGMSNVGSFASGGGGGTNKVAFQDLHFNTHVNKSSPVLALSCATGKHIAKATLYVRKAGEEAQDYYKVILQDVLVSSYQSGGGSGAELPHDQFSLNFAKIEFDYWVQDAKGKLQGGPISMGWDVKASKKS